MPSLKAMAREAQKTPKAGAPKQALNRKQTVFKSTERVADSDLDSETESETGSDSEESSIVAPKGVAEVNSQKPKFMATNEESEIEEEDDEEDEIRAHENVSISQDYSSPNDHSSSESESASRASSDSDDESNEEQEHGNAGVAKELISSHIEDDIQANSHKSRAIPVYNPPDGFMILAESNDKRQKIAELFDQSNLAGKQLWYITAPVSVPIAAVKQVSLHDVQLGRLALSFGGCDYGFVEDQVGERGLTKVMIPEISSSAYRVGKKAIDQTLHLQQVIQLHKSTELSSQNFSIPVTYAKKAARKQPEGLKMRFRPIGFGTEKTGAIGIGSSSSDLSSSANSDADENVDDAAPLSPQPLEQASTSKYERTQQPLKRKLSDFKKDEKASTASRGQFKTNGMLLKTTDTRKVASSLQVMASKKNDSASSTQNNLSSLSPSKTNQVLSSRASGNASSLTDSSNTKVTKVISQRQSSILPPKHMHKSPDISQSPTIAEARSDISPRIVAGSQLPLKKESGKSLGDHDQSASQELSRKERKREIRRLKKDASSKSKI